jgi:tetratricopeptide (TPR) repeat protein
MRNLKLLLLFLLFILSCSTDSSKSLEHYRKAKMSLRNNDIKNASIEIDSAILLNADNLDFFITKANIFEEIDNYENAINIYQDLIEKKYKIDTVRYLLGNCYLSYGGFYYVRCEQHLANEQFDKAISQFDLVLNQNNLYYDAYVGKQKALHNISKYVDALSTLNSAIKLFPDSIELILNRGVEKLYLGDLIASIKDLEISIESTHLDSSNMTTALRFRGNLFLKQKQYRSAIDDYTKSLCFDSQNELSFHSRAQCYEQLGVVDSACSDYRKAADLGYVGLFQKIKDLCE